MKAIARRYNVKYQMSTTEPILYLTFTCGYEYQNLTGLLVETLKAHNIKATFFLNGAFIAQEPKTARAMFLNGHTVASHGLAHLDPPTALASQSGVSKTARDALETIVRYRQLTGCTMRFIFRPPSGNWSVRAFELYRRLGLPVYQWSFALKDWDVNNQPDPQRMLEQLKANSTNGAIIALHPISKSLRQILGSYLEWAKANGFRFAVLPSPEKLE